MLADENLNQSNDAAKKNIKVSVLFAIISLVFIVYSLKLFSLQVIHGQLYRNRSERISKTETSIAAQRGEIFDRTGKNLLATNNDSFAVDLTPGEIPAGHYDTVVSKLASYLGIPKTVIDKKTLGLRRSFSAIEVKTNVTFSTISNIAENITELPGVSWRNQPVRIYPQSTSISHVLGYVGAITKQELQDMKNDGYESNDIIGKSGIEKQYDKLLQGKDGKEIHTIDARGRILDAVPVIEPPQSGKSLVLTIDSRIQKLAEDTLGQRVGAVVVLKPSTGEVLAMVSYPYFDSNIFSLEDNYAEIEKLKNRPNSPMLNRTVNAVYPPASTFKTIMSTAMLNEKAFPEEKLIECTGRLVLGNKTFHCHNLYGHGWLDLKNGLAQSCDVYYWVVGLEYLGIEKIANYAREFGLGQSLSIDFPSQSAGFVPTAEWKERRWKEKWYDGDTLNVSIGQGDTLVTPMHIADMMAMVCNSGTIYKPHLLKEVIDPVTNQVVKTVEPEVLHQSSVDKYVWKRVQNALRYTITNGSAVFPMHNKSIQIAGKTGTAELSQYKYLEGDAKKHWHSWMIAYAPYDAPVEDQYVVATIVEAVNPWEWWAPYATNIIIQGIIKNQTYEESIKVLGFEKIPKMQARAE